MITDQLRKSAQSMTTDELRDHIDKLEAERRTASEEADQLPDGHPAESSYNKILALSTLASIVFEEELTRRTQSPAA